MIELPITLTSTGGAVSFASPVPLGYTKNKGVYRLLVTAEGEWEGLTIRCFWHLPGGTDPASSLVQDGAVDVPASVTAHPGNGCITFEGSDGVKTVTSADLRYRVGSNSGTEDGTMPEPGTPAWEQLVSETKANADAAERAKNDAQAAAEGVKTAAAKADEAAQKADGAAQRAEAAQKATEQAEAAATESIAGAKKEALSAISTGEQGALGAVQQAQTTATEAVQAAQTAAEAAVNAAKTNAVQEVEAAAKPAQTAAAKAEEAAERATQAGIAASNAADDAAGSAVTAETSERNAAASAKKAQDVADSLPVDYMTVVNEIAALKTNKADKANLEAVQKQIGNLDDLTTKAKETLVAAINEAARTGGGAGSMDLRVADGYVQYSTDGGMTWTNLIAMAELKGTDGITPTIGANGNWFLGTTDTGKPSRGKDGAGMDITGATVGQIAKISAVDENGKPTAWEPVDMAIGRNAELPLIYDFTTSEEARWIDTGGTAFSCAQEFILELTAVATETNTSDNVGCASIYTASTSIGRPWANNFMNGIDAMLPKQHSRYFVAHGRKGSGGGWLVDFTIRTIVNGGKVQVYRTFWISGVLAETITGIIIGDASALSGTRVLGAGTRLRIFGV